MESEKVQLEKKEYTDRFLTEQGRKILKYLLMFPGICSGELAKKLEIKKNNMSNALERLKGSQYALIRFENQGRNKLYFLTEWGEGYTKAYLLSPEKGTQQNVFQENSVVDSFEDMETDEKKAEKYILELNKLNSEWQYFLYSFLDSGNDCDDEEIKRLMINLLEILLKLFNMKKQGNYRRVLDKIPSVIVNEKIEQWIRQQSALEPLWDIAAGPEWMQAAEMIDKIFEGNNSLVFSFETGSTKDETYSLILGQVAGELWKFVIEAKTEMETKLGFYNRFIKKYPWCNKMLAFYIAEKYITMIRNSQK